MKNIFISFVLIFLTYSIFGQHIKIQNAKKLGIKFLKYKTGINNFKESSAEISEIKVMDTTFFYEVHVNNVGTVLLASDYMAGPFLIYNKSLKFEFENNEESGFSFWIDGYKQLIRYAIKHPSDSSNYQKEIFKKLYIKATAINGFYLIKTEWNQSTNKNGGCANSNGSYNKSVYDNGAGTSCDCYKCPAGCVSIAVAQIMRYWRYPVYDFDWCNMPYALFDNSPVEEIDATAKLIADVGKKVLTDYCDGNPPCSSGATDLHALQALRDDYNYHSSIDLIHKNLFTSQKKWKKKIREQLDAGQPVYYGGRHGNNGHAFICDGYDYSDNDFFHFNMGHGGDSDYTFFFMFNDDGNDFQQYQTSQVAIINIKPGTTYNCNSNLVVREQFQYLPFGLKYLMYFKPIYGTISTALPPNNVGSPEKLLTI